MGLGQSKRHTGLPYAAGAGSTVAQPAQRGGRNEAIFFPDPAMPCRNYMKDGRCHRRNCDFAHEHTNLVRLLHILREAKQSISVCVFTITCNEIANELVSAHKRGIRVHVITDDDQSHSRGSDIQEFRKQGIRVQMDNSPSHMHHKFAVIDGRLLLTGSFNWTRAAVLENRENVLVTDNAALVQAFSKEFQRLSKEFH